jgi:hypothetical protein
MKLYPKNLVSGTSPGWPQTEDPSGGITIHATRGSIWTRSGVRQRAGIADSLLVREVAVLYERGVFTRVQVQSNVREYGGQHILTRQKRPFVLIRLVLSWVAHVPVGGDEAGYGVWNRNLATLLDLAIGSCAESHTLIPVAQRLFVRTLGKCNCSMWLSG